MADREEKKVGIRLLDGPALNSRKVRTNDGSMSIAAQSAINFLGIQPGRYALTHDEDENMLEFNYEEVEAVAGEEPEATEGSEEDDAEEADEKPHRRRGRPRKAM